MFNYRENKFLKSCILLLIILLLGLSLGYNAGIKSLSETVIILGNEYADRLDAKDRKHQAETRRLVESNRNSVSRIMRRHEETSARLDAIVTRMERLENDNQ